MNANRELMNLVKQKGRKVKLSNFIDPDDCFAKLKYI